MGLSIEKEQAPGTLAANTHTIQDRTWSNPDGSIVTGGAVESGATLVGAPGDVIPLDRARALGLVGGKPDRAALAALEGAVDEAAATAAADAQRVVAEEGQLAQLEADGGGRAAREQEANVEDAKRNAASSEARAELKRKRRAPASNKQADRSANKAADR